ncbi:UNVERIFIED_CONTAM: hypothetical protein NCL1_25893 [Trichonephila clavipes]
MSTKKTQSSELTSNITQLKTIIPSSPYWLTSVITNKKKPGKNTKIFKISTLAFLRKITRDLSSKSILTFIEHTFGILNSGSLGSFSSCTTLKY